MIKKCKINEDIEKSKGITLITLVITIIVLLLLAGITISQLKQNGLLENAKLAKEKSENVQKLENETLANYENNIDRYLQNSQREDNGKKDKLWEVNPEATDANNGRTKGKIVLSDSIDKYDAIVVTARMIDANGLKYYTDSILILKENYYIESEKVNHNFMITAFAPSGRYTAFGLISDTELEIGDVNSQELLNVFGVNF